MRNRQSTSIRPQVCTSSLWRSGVFERLPATAEAVLNTVEVPSVVTAFQTPSGAPSQMRAAMEARCTDMTIDISDVLNLVAVSGDRPIHTCPQRRTRAIRSASARCHSQWLHCSDR